MGMMNISTCPEIRNYLQSRDFTIFKVAPLEQPHHTLDTLAILIGFQYPVFSPLLKTMRSSIRENPTFFLDLLGLSLNEIGSIKSLCDLLQANGLLKGWKMHGARVVGQVADTKEAIDFLTGGWLESSVRFFIQQFLNLEHHAVEIAQNVVVHRPNGHCFELDLLLAIDGDIYWWEAKSGQLQNDQLDRFGEVREELALESRRCTLVLPCAQNEPSSKRSRKRTGFRPIGPHQVPRRVEEIESWYR